jgi:hypothetical protein
VTAPRALSNTPSLTAAATCMPGRPVDKSIYMDPTKSVEERVAALLPQMTCE